MFNTPGVDEHQDLTDRELLIIQLHYADGWSLRRIARGIGCDIAGVSRSHQRALTRLRAYCLTNVGPFECGQVNTRSLLSRDTE